MRAPSTNRAKQPKDTGSSIILKIGFANMVAKELKNTFKTEMVHATESVGTSGLKGDWPCGILKDADVDGHFYHLDSACFDTCERPVGHTEDHREGKSKVEFDSRDHYWRQMCVPPGFAISHNETYDNGELRIYMYGTSENHYASRRDSERAAMDEASAKKLARDMIISHVQLIKRWLRMRTHARDIINLEHTRRRLLGNEGQGERWFVKIAHDRVEAADRLTRFDVLWGQRGNNENWNIKSDNYKNRMTARNLTLDQVKSLRSSISVPEKQALIGKEHLEEYYTDKGRSDWIMGWPLNYWATEKESELEMAHKVMRFPAPHVPEIPRRFRSVREDYRVPDGSDEDGKSRYVPLSAKVAGEYTMPWQPLKPETIREL